MDQLASRSPDFRLHNFDNQFDNTNGRFMDTAAVIKNLDLVVTIDTSIAHIAGALGVPVWVMIPYVEDFRWLWDRTDTPWYPSMKLFRQPVPNDWDAVVRSVVDELKKKQVRHRPVISFSCPKIGV